MLFFGICLLGFAFTTQAQTATPKVTKRQVKQQKRIQHGVANGELTKGETVKLQKQQQRINRSKKRAKADGNVTKKEKAVIHTRQSAASGNIAKKKNNGRNRKN